MDKKDIPIFKLLITDEDQDTGVSYVAMVDRPAIERNWFAFSKEQKFQTANVEKRIVMGPLIVADLPIYRNQPPYGEFYAVFDKATIEKVVQRFFRKGHSSNVNIMHESGQKVSDMYMYQSFIIDREKGIKPPKGFKGLTDGTWFGFYKVENDEVWNEFIKSGELKGFSIEGAFIHEPYVQKDQEIIDQIINVISDISDN